MSIRFIIAYALNLFDFVVTTYWANRFGLGVEANPIGRWLYETGMVCPVKTVGMAGLLALLYMGIKVHPRWEWTSWLVLAGYVLLALYHMTWIICI